MSNYTLFFTDGTAPIEFRSESDNTAIYRALSMVCGRDEFTLSRTYEGAGIGRIVVDCKSHEGEV